MADGFKEGHSLFQAAPYTGPKGKPTILEALDEITDNEMEILNLVANGDPIDPAVGGSSSLRDLHENLVRIRAAIKNRQK